MSKKIVYRKRGFLNPKKGMACFEAIVERFSDDITYAAFEITDCNRKISLNFDYVNDKEKASVKKKVDLLLKELTLFKEKTFD